MSLRLVDAFDVTEYGQLVASNSDDPPIAGGSLTGAGKIMFSTSSLNVGLLKHYLGTDRYWSLFRVSSASQSAQAIGFFDPFFSAFTPPNANMINISNLPVGAIDVFNFDTFNPVSGSQRIFVEDASQNLYEMNPSNFVMTPDPFTGPNGDYRGNLGTVTDFEFTRESAQSLFFTGLTDGIAGETFRLGTNVYPLGLDMMHCDTGNINGVAVSNRLCYVDIYRRELTGIVGGADVPNGDFTSVWPGRANNAFAQGDEPEIGGDAFQWIPFVFAPDDDSTFAHPKGRIQTITRSELATGTVLRIYVRLTEFNPFNVAPAAGQPPRTHGRIRLTSRITPNYDPPFDLVGQDTIVNPNAEFPVVYDHLRNRFVFGFTNTADSDPFPTDTGNQTVGIYAPQAEVAVVTSPAPRDVPRTNDVVRYQSGVYGDLGERIAGVDIDWTLTRRSTEGEALDASTFPGSSQLDQFPVDENGAGDAILTILSDGVELTDGVDYTVNTATGVVTWITDQSGAALVAATYEHRTDGASPAHGTLLTSRSTSNDSGVAETQIAYPDDDDLVGTLDHLDAQEA